MTTRMLRATFSSSCSSPTANRKTRRHPSRNSPRPQALCHGHDQSWALARMRGVGASGPGSDASKRFAQQRDEKYSSHDGQGAVERQWEAAQRNQQHGGGGWWM